MLSALAIGLFAIVVGVAVTAALYFGLDWLIRQLPDKLEERFRAVTYLLPAGVLLLAVLVYPLIQTVIYSLMDNSGKKFVGLKNYTDLFASRDFISVLFNNFLWIAFVPAATVIVGVLFAQLTNQVGPRREKVIKSVIFMPMAISFISASTIWKLLYLNAAEGRPQIGLLTNIVSIFGIKPQNWLTISDFRLNSFLLMIIIVWLQAGYAMVLISAAIKAVPEETLEAAKIDGANALQTFFRVLVPQIRGTIMSVFVTVLILVMKIFDIVLGMTGGQFETSVLGFKFYQEYFLNSNVGPAAAVVTVLTVLIAPLVYVQIRTVRHQETLR